MRRVPGQAVFAALLGLAAASAAVERSEPSVTRGRSTSSVKEISTKPLYLFSSKGRRDPFVRSLDMEAPPENPHSTGFSVTELKLVGFIVSDGAPVALFKHRMGATTYTLRAGELYTPGNLKVPSVSGKIQPDRKVVLVQGEKKLVFSSFSSKRP